jgi:hypothetical protein
MERIDGQCHCGNLGFTLTWPEPGSPIPTRACGCGMCTKHAAVWTSHPAGGFRLTVADPGQVTMYRFGTRTADFHICRRCGVLPIAVCRIEGARFAVVNVHSFVGVDVTRLVRRETSFDGETTDSRLDRRRRTWTPEAV